MGGAARLRAALLPGENCLNVAHGKSHPSKKRTATTKTVTQVLCGFVEAVLSHVLRDRTGSFPPEFIHVRSLYLFSGPARRALFQERGKAFTEIFRGPDLRAFGCRKFQFTIDFRRGKIAKQLFGYAETCRAGRKQSCREVLRGFI